MPTKEKRPKYKVITTRVVRFAADSSLPEVLLITSLIITKFLVDADFIYPYEIVLPLLLLAVVVSLGYYSFRLVLRSTLAAHVAALSLTYSLYSYSFLPHWFTNLVKLPLLSRFETPFIMSLMTLAWLWTAYACIGLMVQFLVNKVTFIRNLQIQKVILFAVCFVFVVQGGKFMLRVFSSLDELRYRPSVPALSRDSQAAVKKPDIYYFVFDRYGNQATLEREYQFDNQPFLDSLKNIGFSTRDNAYANYPFTMHSISSTLAMDYHSDKAPFNKPGIQPAYPYRAVFQNPPIAQILKANGYEYNQVSSWWDFSRIRINATRHPSRAFRLRLLGSNYYLGDLARDVINKSILSPWLIKGISVGDHHIARYELDTNPRQNFYTQFGAIHDIAHRGNNTPQFTFAHILAPHDPYLFNKDGSETKYDPGRNDNGVDEHVKYTNTLTYINGEITKLMTDITKANPDAVIVIQADEGPYPKEFRHKLTPNNYYDPAKLTDNQLKQKFGILASYRMPGVDAATVKSELNSSVNAFPFVLKHYLGYNVNFLPDCQFSTGNKFRIYDYHLMTPRLQPEADSKACHRYADAISL